MNPLIEVLRDPAVIHGWDAGHWNQFLPLTRGARLLGRCFHLFEQHALLDSVPARILDHLRGALNQTRYVQGQARREWRLVTRVLAREGIDVLPLKGLSYLLGDLPPAQWRNLSDIDLLLPVGRMADAERILKRANWVPSGEFDAYDEHYYREWMHELPPLMHRNREVEVDLHHNLAPPVSRVRIDASRLWDAATTYTGKDAQPVRMLQPADILLHNAVHLFMNDELRGGLRDVVDFRDLFDGFRVADDGFERALLGRAAELGCGRPLYYAVSTARRLVHLQASEAFVAEVSRSAPNAVADAAMSGLIDQLLAPRRPGLRRTRFADTSMFVRSHWIRMPPGMLFRHLVRKTVKRHKPDVATEDLPG